MSRCLSSRNAFWGWRLAGVPLNLRIPFGSEGERNREGRAAWGKGVGRRGNVDGSVVELQSVSFEARSGVSRVRELLELRETAVLPCMLLSGLDLTRVLEGVKRRCESWPGE